MSTKHNFSAFLCCIMEKPFNFFKPIRGNHRSTVYGCNDAVTTSVCKAGTKAESLGAVCEKPD